MEGEVFLGIDYGFVRRLLDFLQELRPAFLLVRHLCIHTRSLWPDGEVKLVNRDQVDEVLGLVVWVVGIVARFADSARAIGLAGPQQDELASGRGWVPKV